jgi:hypothetical protein
MIQNNLFIVALVLASTILNAQAPKPAPSAHKPTTPTTKPAAPSQAPPASDRYVPAIMQQRMTTLTGCLQYSQDYTLTNATVSKQGDVALAAGGAPKSFRLEGISPARLSVLVGKRVEVTGAFQDDARPGGAHPAAGAAKSLPRFEAIAVAESSGSCS